MVYINKYDVTGENSIRGNRAEIVFGDLARDRGYQIKYIEGVRQYTDHVDIEIYNDDRKEFFTVQIKAQKKINRSDNIFTNKYIWVEFTNVVGNHGWIYGNYDIIAFERQYDFLIVSRKDLLSLCERLVDFSMRVYSSSEALYKIYQRSGRKDSITLIKEEDVEKLDNVIWLKKK